ncbi:MAG: MmgE/PrpD family protein [Dehalococcoidia bacterium]|nr:MmgE/PrpD family protein [Dehalococcoidia bacterium]
MLGSISRRLATFIQGVDCDNLPDEVREKAKACILNAIGVGMAAYNTDLARTGIASATAEVEKTTGGATILVNGARASLPDAAFANAVMFHSRAQEDTLHEARTHLGPVVVPAALAVGQALGSSGRDFIAAVVAGYETACAMGVKNATLSVPRGFRATSIYAIFGAAAAAGKLLGLDERRLANALGFAASLAGGTNECFLAGTSEWRFETAMAAHNGVLAALLAANGGEAAGSAIEGRAGFLQAFTGTTENAERILAGLGEKYRALEVVFKPYPVGGINQVPCIAALELAAEAKLDSSEIAAIEIRTARSEATYPGAANRGPFSQIGATLMSTVYCVSLALSQRQITLEGLQRYDDQTILGLVARSTLVPSDLPELSCDLKLTRTSGQIYEKSLRKSEHDFAYDYAGVTRLMRSLAPEMAISAATLEKLIDAVATIEKCDNVGAIVEMLVGKRDEGEALAKSFGTSH